MTYAPCRNSNCSHYGQSHPNCHCYRGVSEQRLKRAGLERPGITTNNEPMMAEGGKVPECQGLHKKDCKYYMAEGGGLPEENPAETLGHVVINSGLLDTLKNTGKTSLTNFSDKHSRLLNDAKNYGKPGITEDDISPNTMGNRLGKHLSSRDFDKAANLIHGTPLAGSISKSIIKDSLQKMHPEIFNQEPHPEGFRGAMNYLNSAEKGKGKLKSAVSDILSNSSSSKIKSDLRGSFKDHIKDLGENPEKALDVGGNLSHYLPSHSIQLSALTGAATSYLQSIKPKQSQTGILNNPLPIDKAQEDMYDRQVDIAEQPMRILGHIKNGSLLPQDVKTMTTVFPALYNKMTSLIGESIIEHKSQDKDIPYHIRSTLSLFLGQPLDSTMTQSNMMAALVSNTPKTPPQPPGTTKKPSKPSVAQQQKEAEMFATNTQSREGKIEG